MGNVLINDMDVDILDIGIVYSVYKDAPWNYSLYKRKISSVTPCYILMYVQEGSFYHSEEGKESIFVPSGSLILTKVDKQPFCNTSAELPFRYISIRFYTREAIPFAFEQNSRIALFPGESVGCEDKMQTALRMYRERPFGWKLRLRCITEEMLLHVFEAYYRAGENGVSPLIQDSTAVIRRRIFSELLCVEDVAEECGVSTAHLIRSFSRHMGMTPKKYMDRLRVERACELLKCTDKSMEEIAAESGFSEARHMRRVFHEIVGTSPREYRSKI